MGLKREITAGGDKPEQQTPEEASPWSPHVAPNAKGDESDAEGHAIGWPATPPGVHVKPRSRLRWTAALGAALLVAACTGTPSPTPVATSTPSPVPAETDSEPTPVACASGAVCDGPLAAGTYTSTTTGAKIKLELDGGWSGQADIEGAGFALLLDDITGAHGVSVAAFGGEIFTDACDPSQTSTIGTAAADFVEFLRARDGVVAGEPVQLQVGGRPALQVDLTTELPPDCAEGPQRIWLWVLPVVGDFHFNDAETARVIAVDAGSTTVVIVIEAFPDADYDHLLERAMEVVGTMTIEPL